MSITGQSSLASLSESYTWRITELEFKKLARRQWLEENIEPSKQWDPDIQENTEIKSETLKTGRSQN